MVDIYKHFLQCLYWISSVLTVYTSNNERKSKTFNDYFNVEHRTSHRVIIMQKERVGKLTVSDTENDVKNNVHGSVRIPTFCLCCVISRHIFNGFVVVVFLS